MTLYSLYKEYAATDKDKAMEYAGMFLDRIDSTSMNHYLAPLYSKVAEWYENDRFMFSTAIHYATRALDIYAGTGNRYQEAWCRYSLARLYLKSGQYHKSLRHATEAADYFETSGNTVETMECYELLGILYEVCRDYDKSIEYLQAYASAARKIADSSRILIGLNNLAVFASLTGDTAKTIKLLSESIAQSGTFCDTSLICKLYINLAAAYAQAGQYGKSEKYLDTAYSFTNNIDIRAQWWLHRGNLYMVEGNSKQAAEAFKKAASYYSQGEFDQTLKSIYGSLNELYREMGDTIRAYHYLQEVYDIDSRMNREDIMMELFKAQNEIERAHEQDALRASKSRQQVVIISCFFIIILGVLTSVLILRKRAFDIRQRELQIENEREISEIKKNQQYRTDKILRSAIDRLEALKQESKSASVRSGIHAICEDLRHSKDEDAWKEIEQYIPETNSIFYKNLITAFPGLTVNESRLCVFLNRNLTTKQISEITRQSPESINVARTRLRRKLGISGNDISIQEFLRRYN